MKTEIEVRVHNDGKGKDNSFEAYLNYPYIEIPCFGANETEVLDKLRANVQDLILDLNKIDYSKLIMVDWKGYRLIELMLEHNVRERFKNSEIEKVEK